MAKIQNPPLGRLWYAESFAEIAPAVASEWMMKKMHMHASVPHAQRGYCTASAASKALRSSVCSESTSAPLTSTSLTSVTAFVVSCSAVSLFFLVSAWERRCLVVARAGGDRGDGVTDRRVPST